jgi:hypothetical protein
MLPQQYSILLANQKVLNRKRGPYSSPLISLSPRENFRGIKVINIEYIVENTLMEN